MVTRPDMALPGYTIFSPDYRTAEFWVRASDTYPRRRFTLAFLLGYLLLNPLEGSHQRQQENDYEDPLYTQALEFASSLLIPTWMLEQRLSRAGAAANGRRLARVFRVSGDAMSMALKRL